ncbi:MAG: FtsX-like permease family protein, partial [Gemmatimonadota bacterium]
GAAGGVLALVLSIWGDALLRRTLLAGIPLEGSALDARQGAFVAILVVFAALIAGVVPALVASGTPVMEALKSGAREGGGRRHSLRTALVVVQGTLSVILLIGAGLFVRSFSRATSVDLGFVATNLLVASPDLNTVARTPEDLEQRWLRLQDEVRALPGVALVAQSVTIPFESQWEYSLLIDGDTLPPLKGGGPYVNGVSVDYFRTMETPIRRGRDFAPTDRDGSALVAVINEAMAAQVWPGRDALGQCFGVEKTEGCVTVIGIVPSARMTELADQAPPQYFRPIAQWHPDMRSLMVRLAAPKSSGEAAVRGAILGVEASLPYVDVRPVTDIVDQQLQTWKLGATMFTLFGVLGLIVAALGLYSVIAHDVSQRRREIGVRMALGARREDVARLVVGSGVRQALVGVTLGLALAWVVSTSVADLLFETSPRDPVIYGSVVAVLLLVAVVASFIPARRASKLDPATVLREG